MSLPVNIKEVLRPYQIEAYNKMIQKNMLMYDDMGLGKTLTTLSAIFGQQAFPFLVVGPVFSMYVWEQEIQKWFNEPVCFYYGKPQEREEQWRDFIKNGYKILITNYALFPEVAMRSGIRTNFGRTSLNPTGTFHWESTIWDEVHMSGLFNHKTQISKLCHQWVKQVPVRYLLTGTPYRKGCIDLYNPLHLIEPKQFPSYWKFVEKYCIVIRDGFGVSIERNPRDVKEFRAMLKHHMIRRLKTEVRNDIPGKIRQPLFVTMNPDQQKLYNELEQEMMALIPNTNDILLTPNQLSLLTRLKQVLACPEVFGMDRSAGLKMILEHSHNNLDNGEPVVVFTPYSSVVPYIAKAFRDEYHKQNIEVYQITGGLSAQEFANQWKGFQNSKNPYRVLVCVIKSAASFPATAAHTAYFLGYEEDFTLNEQAEDRLHRDGQTKLVNIYYIMHKHTVEEEVAARLNDKKVSSIWVIGTDQQYASLSRNKKI